MFTFCWDYFYTDGLDSTDVDDRRSNIEALMLLNAKHNNGSVNLFARWRHDATNDSYTAIIQAILCFSFCRRTFLCLLKSSVSAMILYVHSERQHL